MNELIYTSARFAILAGFCFASGYSFGRRMFLLSLFIVSFFNFYAWLPIILGVDTLSFPHFSIYDDIAFIVAMVINLFIMYIGYLIGKKRRENPPKPKEVSTPIVLSSFGRKA